MTELIVEGAIFDVDDTLLDNKSASKGHGLHELSRRTAIHTVGGRHGIPALAELSIEDNYQGFITAPAHTLQAAVWNILYRAGTADSEVINPHHSLLNEIMQLKNNLHADVLRQHGVEVKGARAFVHGLAQRHNIRRKLAIGSSAIMRDITMSLDVIRLRNYFPAGRIVSVEGVTHPKPHPEVFQKAFAKLDLPDSARERVWIFEDDLRGVVAGVAAGHPVATITTRFSKKEFMSQPVKPTIVGDSYEELAERFGFQI